MRHRVSSTWPKVAGVEAKMEEVKGAGGKRNFVIPVSNGIFEHCKKIKGAIWLLLWYIDKTTFEEEKDGTVEGWVLGRSPVKDSRVAEELGCNRLVIQRWRRRLEQGKRQLGAVLTSEGWM